MRTTNDKPHLCHGPVVYEGIYDAVIGQKKITAESIYGQKEK